MLEISGYGEKMSPERTRLQEPYQNGGLFVETKEARDVKFSSGGGLRHF